MIQIFSDISAKINEEWSKSLNLESWLSIFQLQGQIQFDFEYDSTNKAYSIKTKNLEVLNKLYNSICEMHGQLIPEETNELKQHIETNSLNEQKSAQQTVERGINCSILQPTYSRFGRLISSNVALHIDDAVEKNVYLVDDDDDDYIADGKKKQVDPKVPKAMPIVENAEGSAEAEQVPIVNDAQVTKPLYNLSLSHNTLNSCPHCSFTSNRPSHLKKHLQLHIQNIPLLQCNQCPFKTIKRTHLGRHKITQHVKNKFHCKKCAYITGTEKLLRTHNRLRHSGPEVLDKVYQCEICSYTTLKHYRFIRHKKAHVDVLNSDSGEVVKEYNCNVTGCNYVTQIKNRFLRHVSGVHTNDRPFMCEECGMSFKRKDALRQHRMVHKDKTMRTLPYHCDQCPGGKAFRSKAHLLDHMSSHSNQRPFLCEICGASFKTKSVQRKHVNTIHKNPRAFKCGRCNKCFNTKYALSRHERRHMLAEEKVQELDDVQMAADSLSAVSSMQLFIPNSTQSALLTQTLKNQPINEAIQSFPTGALETSQSLIQQGTVQIQMDATGQNFFVVSDNQTGTPGTTNHIVLTQKAADDLINVCDTDFSGSTDVMKSVQVTSVPINNDQNMSLIQQNEDEAALFLVQNFANVV